MRVLSKGFITVIPGIETRNRGFVILILSNPGSLFVVNHHGRISPPTGFYFTDTRVHTACCDGTTLLTRRWPVRR